MTAPHTELLPTPTAADRLIVALDVDSAAKARNVVAELEGHVNTFKIGLQLFSAAGPKLVEEFVEAGKRIFLDLKFHDIPNTVAKAGIEAARMGVWMFNVHASGGAEMMRAVAGEVAEFCGGGNYVRPHIIGVTVLTSSSVGALSEIGLEPNVDGQVARLARLTADAGLDGVVASAREMQIIRRSVEDRKFLVVTPGIRPDSGTNADQKRVMTPGAAIAAGADHLVVGRPILDAAYRAGAARSILNEIEDVS